MAARIKKDLKIVTEEAEKLETFYFDMGDDGASLFVTLL